MKGLPVSSPDRVFEALSSTARRRILAYIADGPLSAGEIGKRFDMSQPAVSKHLSILKTAGLVWTERQGASVLYGMERETLSGTLAGFVQEVCPPSRALRKERRDAG
ncbi:metalloregulator ArsR/SmtB family transcription factor [Jannaschia sp.]|nr:metalloregulator ArsR/SmtB family transcription factor [Jannaschia sp.]